MKRNLRYSQVSWRRRCTRRRIPGRIYPRRLIYTRRTVVVLVLAAVVNVATKAITKRRKIKCRVPFPFYGERRRSANKTFLFQETKALLNPKRMKSFLEEKIKLLGTSACPPYHLALVVGGLSAEQNLKTVKMASAQVLRHVANHRERVRPSVPRRRLGTTSFTNYERDGHWRAVWRQILLPRRSRDSFAETWRFSVLWV